MSKKTLLAPLLMLMLLIPACGRGSTPASQATAAAPAEAASAATEPANTPTLRLDCIASNPQCQALKIAGDDAYRFPDNSASPFSGFADPSIRKDPLSDTLWLSYSWPNYHIDQSQRTPGVDIHLAKSTDGGLSWSFVKSLWPSTALANPADPSQQGYLENEVSNLLPVPDGSQVTWYAARLSYFLPGGGGGAKPLVSSFQLRLFKAGSPEALSDAPYSVLGSDITSAGWGVTQNLQSLSPDLKAVAFWNEPALYFDGGRLYLLAVGFAYDSQGAVMSKNGVFVFSTDPAGAPTTWRSPTVRNSR